MPLNIECIVDRGMDRNEALRRFGRFEALHLSFASSNRLVRVLRTVVGTQSLLMPSRETNFAKRRPVRSQFIADNNRGDKALAAKELAQKAHCRDLVAPGLNKNFQNLALTIDSAPQVHLLSRERDHTRTAGTLLTRLDSPAVTAESPKTLLRSRPPIAAATSEERTAASNPVTTIKRPTNIRSSGQSIYKPCRP